MLAGFGPTYHETATNALYLIPGPIGTRRSSEVPKAIYLGRGAEAIRVAEGDEQPLWFYRPGISRSRFLNHMRFSQASLWFSVRTNGMALTAKFFASQEC